jgi:hypothetical protein
LCALTGSGCHLSDTGASAYLPPDQYFAELSLEHHAINLSLGAPYDTVTLRTTRTMGDGGPVPGEVVYRVTSPSLSITNGVLKADSAVTRATVYATLTYGTITRTDSAVVSVIATAPTALRDFGLRVAPGDSAKTAASRGNLKTIPLLRQSPSGTDLSALLIALRSSDSTIAAITQSGSTVSIDPKRPGRVMFYTSTYAFGTVWRDSLVFTVGWPVVFGVRISERFVSGTRTTVLGFGHQDFTIGLGGCVTWTSHITTQDIDMQFEDPSRVSAPAGRVCPGAFQLLHGDVGGNIAPFRNIPFDGRDVITEEDFEYYVSTVLSGFRARVFSTPGVFPYRSTLHGTSGLVRVCDEAADTICAPRRLGGW